MSELDRLLGAQQKAYQEMCKGNESEAVDITLKAYNRAVDITLKAYNRAVDAAILDAAFPKPKPIEWYRIDKWLKRLWWKITL